ncbi:MAG: glycosyl hydrolase [Ignavibacteria bacterium]|nr:glycosyl hydrolase [Ignavibacteria bacterium]
MSKLVKYIIFYYLLIFSGCSIFNERETYEAGINIKLLPPQNGIYHGVTPGIDDKSIEESEKIIEEYVKLSNSKPVWICFSNHWFDGIKFPAEKVKLIWNMGYIPYIRVMPWSKFSEGVIDEKYSLFRIIEGEYDYYISIWAYEARNSGIPILIDFCPEMNGNWFPWSGILNGGSNADFYGNKSYPDGPERYIDAYKHFISIFRRLNANNITWVFHPNYNSNPDEEWNSMKYYYLGDDCIDWIGISVYGAQKPTDVWIDFDTTMDSAYKEMVMIGRNKAYAILEFGVIETQDPYRKANWLKSAFQSITSGKYPLLKAISYWHSKWENRDGSISDMCINSSFYSLRSFREGIKDTIFKSSPTFLIWE